MGKYQVIQVAGTGNFAKVYECTNAQSGERVAIKILKKGYERDADFECDVLKGIGKCDPHDKEGIVKLVERATYQGLAIIVFKLKGAPLRSLRMPVQPNELKQAAKDIANALAFLHFRVKAVHTDLKPENVLAELPGQAGDRQWALCDLGSASFYKDGQLDRDLITTRPYRAPEVVLNRGWSFPADAWSLGCILYELKTGKKLFDCHNDGDHLRMMEDRLGAIPASMRGATRVPQAFALRPPTLIAEEFRHEPEFASLLLGLLEFEPSKRMRCDVVATHPFITSATTRSAPPTDSVDKLNAMMRGLSTGNDENAGYRVATKKPIAAPLPPAAQAPFTFGPSGLNGGVRPGQALGAMGSSRANYVAAPLAGAKRHSMPDSYYDELIPMKERLPSSLPTSANNSPKRLGSISAHNSPRLVSPAYPTMQQRPLSHRLTYL